MSINSINAKLAATIAPYEAQRKSAAAQFEQTGNELRTAQDDALRAAYLAVRNGERKLPQLSAAAGGHGGVSESSALKLENDYQNIRYGHNRDFNNNYAKAKLGYDTTISNIDAMIAAARAQAEAEKADFLAAEAAAAAAAEAAASRYSGGYSRGYSGGGSGSRSSTNTSSTGREIVWASGRDYNTTKLLDPKKYDVRYYSAR